MSVDLVPTFACDGPDVIVTLDNGGHPLPGLRLALVPPTRVERSTGNVRDPRWVDMPAELVRLLDLGVPAAQTDASVIGVMVHLGSRNVLAIGPFAGSGAAEQWWEQPFNRLRTEPIVFLLAVAPVGAP